MPLIDFDWRNPRYLPRKRKEGRDVEALATAKMKRRKHKPSKAHATAKDIAIAAARKAAKAKATVKAKDDAAVTYKIAVRAYFTGQTDQHP